MYEKDVIDYVDNVYTAMNKILGNLRYSDGFKENGLKIKDYNIEIDNLTIELDKVNDKINNQ